MHVAQGKPNETLCELIHRVCSEDTVQLAAVWNGTWTLTYHVQPKPKEAK